MFQLIKLKRIFNYRQNVTRNESISLILINSNCQQWLPRRGKNLRHLVLCTVQWTKYQHKQTNRYPSPDRPCRPRDVEAPRIPKQGCKLCAPAALGPQEISLVLISLTCRLEPRPLGAARRIKSLKNCNDPIGIEPAAFQLVVQCFNQLCYSVPPRIYEVCQPI
jgi:hypothetical protein